MDTMTTVPANSTDDELSVAVVDTDAAVRDAIQLVLEGHGYVVRTYENGEAFVAGLAKHGTPRCLILEPHLPGMSAVEVARAVGGAATPIIGLTARPDSRSSMELAREGIVVILAKPATAAMLLDQVQSATHSRTT